MRARMTLPVATAAALALLVACGGGDVSGDGNQASSGDVQASEATSLEDLGISAEGLDGLDLENLDAEDLDALGLDALGLDDVDPALLDDLLEQIGVSVEDLDGADTSEGDTYSDPELVEDVTDLGDDGWINATAGHVMWVDGDLTVDVFVPMGGPSESE